MIKSRSVAGLGSWKVTVAAAMDVMRVWQVGEMPDRWSVPMSRRATGAGSAANVTTQRAALTGDGPLNEQTEPNAVSVHL